MTSGRDTHNIFSQMGQKMSGPFKIWVFFVFLSILIIGINFFIEDTYSSYYGIKALEAKYDLNTVTWDPTYWSMSLMAQVAQIAAMYIFFVDTKRNKAALIAAAIFFVIDVTFDMMYRANGYIGGFERGVAVSLNTLVFSMGAEIAITIGFGYTVALLPGTILEIRKLFSGGSSGKGGSKKKSGTPPRSSGRQQPPNRPQSFTTAMPSGSRPMREQEINRQLDEMLDGVR